MKNSEWADMLWYTGHVITGFAIVTNPYHFFLGVSLVVVGQALTIISRPVGRLRGNDHEEGETRGFFQSSTIINDRPTVITI
jgi:hypothetical protein